MTDDSNQIPKHFHLMGPNGERIESSIPGVLAGNRKIYTYGLLNCGLPDCGFPDRGLPPNQPKIRVYFASEETAIAAGYRPCGGCLPQQYQQWKKGPQNGEPYPWKITPTQVKETKKKKR